MPGLSIRVSSAPASPIGRSRRLGSGAACGLELERREQGAQLLEPPARATSALNTATGRPSSTARAASFATEAVLPAPGGPLRSRRAGCGNGANRKSWCRAWPSAAIGSVELSSRSRGEQAIAHAGGQLVVRRHPRQPFHARRG